MVTDSHKKEMVKAFQAEGKGGVWAAVSGGREWLADMGAVIRVETCSYGASGAAVWCVNFILNALRNH